MSPIQRIQHQMSVYNQRVSASSRTGLMHRLEMLIHTVWREDRTFLSRARRKPFYAYPMLNAHSAECG